MKKQRDELDRYYTPSWLSQRCVDWVFSNIPVDGDILEPSFGGGSFLRALARNKATGVVGVEIDPSAFRAVDGSIVSAVYNDDFLSMHAGHFGNLALVVGNPPYKTAQAFIQKSWSLLKPGGHVAFLLRLSFLEGRKRREFWKNYPPKHVLVVPDRPSFIGDGKTDRSAYALFVWQKTYTLVDSKLGWLGGEG